MGGRLARRSESRRAIPHDEANRPLLRPEYESTTGDDFGRDCAPTVSGAERYGDDLSSEVGEPVTLSARFVRTILVAR